MKKKNGIVLVVVGVALLTIIVVELTLLLINNKKESNKAKHIENKTETEKLGEYLKSSGWKERASWYTMCFDKACDWADNYTEATEFFQYERIDIATLEYTTFSYNPDRSNQFRSDYLQQYVYNYKTDIVTATIWSNYLDDNGQEKWDYSKKAMYNYSAGTSECTFQNYRDGLPATECDIKNMIGFMDMKTKLLEFLSNSKVDIEKIKVE